MEKINVAELLIDCPQGMELDCTMYDNLYFDSLNSDYYGTINCYTLIDGIKTSINFTKYGTFNNHIGAKCVIFPKGKTTWEGFHRPFKDGDIVFYDNCVSIFKEWGDETLFRNYVKVDIINSRPVLCDKTFSNGKSIKRESRFATEEEKIILFEVIKNNGYKWNPETKTLEKLPKFKVGDRIVDIYKKHLHCDSGSGKISQITDDKYIFTDGSYLHIKNQDKWRLVPNKFDITTLVPFESKVLVRNDEKQYWIPSFWGCKRSDGYTTTFGWCRYCIPYDGNEHLLETNKDCNEYYKTWK